MTSRTKSHDKGRIALGSRAAIDAEPIRLDPTDHERLRSSLSVQRTTPTLRVLALEKLRTAIIEGEFPPHTRLIERQLCDLLGVSRTVVREILRQLEAEGWVVNPPYKGPTVAALTFEQARQTYEIREALEGLAARLCARRATARQIEELEAIVDEMARAQAQHNLRKQVDCVRRFYEVMLNATGNELLAEFLASQHHRLMRLRSISLSQPKRAAVSVIEKRRLVAAIRRRDEKAAQAASELHIRKAAEAAQEAYRADAEQTAVERGRIAAKPKSRATA
ncbi:GntR family transcriptional regulator [Bradyrhizobium sp. NP1]|uniref:GntR family transcriptional regulator n=1 Tax=Bradyrhizobium sp. NP1 TaxID=3049772 RepID=UPI0025A51AB8|nr:GntR family transcriptional regulator [Bradyrhizobium sp. NP1]WJR79150.1 GntR family transcriptional regulator [Bradyrhizobium sp. NP1]